VKKNLIPVLGILIILVLLFIAVPQTYSFLTRFQANSLAKQGCSEWLKKGNAAAADNLFSRAAQLDPAYVPLSSAGKTLSVTREISIRFGYEQQWLDGLHTLQGYCEETLNPSK
jgi:hypothetical protein